MNDGSKSNHYKTYEETSRKTNELNILRSPNNSNYQLLKYNAIGKLYYLANWFGEDRPPDKWDNSFLKNHWVSNENTEHRTSLRMFGTLLYLYEHCPDFINQCFICNMFLKKLPNVSILHSLRTFRCHIYDTLHFWSFGIAWVGL